jgi:hypothetical protein
MVTVIVDTVVFTRVRLATAWITSPDCGVVSDRYMV